MTSKCERCGALVEPYDTIHYGNVSKSETLCTACFNREAAEQMHRGSVGTSNLRRP